MALWESPRFSAAQCETIATYRAKTAIAPMSGVEYQFVTTIPREPDWFTTIGYVTPKDKLEERETIIFAKRKQQLHQARERRQSANRSNSCALLSQAPALANA